MIKRKGVLSPNHYHNRSPIFLLTLNQKARFKIESELDMDLEGGNLWLDIQIEREAKKGIVKNKSENDALALILALFL